MLDKFERLDVDDERKRLHCVSCKRKTIHTVEAKCRGRWSDDYNHMDGGATHLILRCGACDTVCYETVSWDSEDHYYDENHDLELIYTSVQYPAPASAHFTFNTESTPYKLNQILDEMLYALAGNKLVLATMGLRLAIEFIVKDNECVGRDLAPKINDLSKKGLIDSDQKDLLHLIRQRGNAGAHEAVGMKAEELIAGMSIIDGLLEKLYNGPARHQNTIKRARHMIKALEPKKAGPKPILPKPDDDNPEDAL